MLNEQQIKQFNDFSLMIKDELDTHIKSKWLDEYWCEDYMHALAHLDNVLTVVKDLLEQYS